MPSNIGRARPRRGISIEPISIRGSLEPSSGGGGAGTGSGGSVVVGGNVVVVDVVVVVVLVDVVVLVVDEVVVVVSAGADVVGTCASRSTAQPATTTATSTPRVSRPIRPKSASADDTPAYVRSM
jgi:hypothetical protein